jgi:hypothetical protein
MWILITVGILAVIVVLLGVFLTRKEKTKMHPMEKGMAWGGIAGMLFGIALVEVWGYEYPVPFILWMLGMAGGQLIGWLYREKKS